MKSPVTMPVSLRILIVEDEAIIALGLEYMLESMGHTVCGIAGTAAEAIDLAARLKPDLAIMDVMLRDSSSGIQAAREIWRRFGVRSLFASAFDRPDVRQQTADIRPLGFLPKPYRHEELQRRLHAAMPEPAARIAG